MIEHGFSDQYPIFYVTNLEELSYQSTRTDNYWHAACYVDEINTKLLHALIS